MAYPNAIKDCLYNLSMNENNNANMTFAQSEYYRGLIIGLITGLMYKGLSFTESWGLIKDNLPQKSITFINESGEKIIVFQERI